jgi:hypothetical protein
VHFQIAPLHWASQRASARAARGFETAVFLTMDVSVHQLHVTGGAFKVRDPKHRRFAVGCHAPVLLNLAMILAAWFGARSKTQVSSQCTHWRWCDGGRRSATRRSGASVAQNSVCCPSYPLPWRVRSAVTDPATRNIAS